MVVRGAVIGVSVRKPAASVTDGQRRKAEADCGDARIGGWTSAVGVGIVGNEAGGGIRFGPVVQYFSLFEIVEKQLIGRAINARVGLRTRADADATDGGRASGSSVVRCDGNARQLRWCSARQFGWGQRRSR